MSTARSINFQRRRVCECSWNWNTDYYILFCNTTELNSPLKWPVISYCTFHQNINVNSSKRTVSIYQDMYTCLSISGYVHLSNPMAVLIFAPQYPNSTAGREQNKTDAPQCVSQKTIWLAHMSLYSIFESAFWPHNMQFKAVNPPDYISSYLCLFDQFVGRALLSIQRISGLVQERASVTCRKLYCILYQMENEIRTRNNRYGVLDTWDPGGHCHGSSVRIPCGQILPGEYIREPQHKHHSIPPTTAPEYTSKHFAVD